ncbi:acetyltransferase [Mesobacillus foraminis]|uniref:Acetyltransferase EpsM n=1 Tax=Mesobacillus foraminis TaxID=279826 RepID=A0A4R2B7Z1_9BACI|nr:acetyltransferase [Mesobacillus foraminis]TCN22192.1 acetyltransferase EpsM [Mesobacillus foraminis]
MKIALIGIGGHSKVIQEMISEQAGWEIIGYFDDQYEQEFFKDECYFGPIQTSLKMHEYFCDVKYLVAIGNNRTRKSIVEKLNLPADSYATLVHKSSIISKRAIIGHGTVVMPGAVVNTDSQIGQHSIINTNAVIEHDNMLGSYVHISPNATLTGNVKAGDGVQVGAGAAVIPSKSIGEWAIIGAGGVVIEDIPSYSLAVGVPAKSLRNTGEV